MLTQKKKKQRLTLNVESGSCSVANPPLARKRSQRLADSTQLIEFKLKLPLHGAPAVSHVQEGRVLISS